MNDMEQSTFTPKQIQVMNMRYTMICGILPLLDKKKALSRAIKDTAKQYGYSEQTIRNYLAKYQASGCKEALAPKVRAKREELTEYEKNIRWGLNKFYYTSERRSLSDAYTLMLKEKYYRNGTLVEEHPTMCQFRYYYRKHNKKRNEIISRQGLSAYQRDYRTLLGAGVQDYCPSIGSYMLDSTVCDIYLVNDAGNVIGRPILTVAVDGYSGLCCGYSLGWEGGTYSLRKLMENIVEDKVEHCRQFGIKIDSVSWPCKELSGRMITDKGTEYTSEGFSQLTEMGIVIENLPPYRPELKSAAERFFCLVADCYKPFLKNKGLVEKDFGERTGTDYRKLACLTLKEFQAILIRCIIYYNSDRIVENFPYTKEMLDANVKPYASCIWNWSKQNSNSVNLIETTKEEVWKILLPRTTGKFTRRGLVVNKLRYKAKGFNEEFLEGNTAVVAYNPDNMNVVWLLEEGRYVPFDLIDARFKEASCDEAKQMIEDIKVLCKAEKEAQLLAKVKLASDIEIIAGQLQKPNDICIKDMRDTRKAERLKLRMGENTND